MLALESEEVYKIQRRKVVKKKVKSALRTFSKTLKNSNKRINSHGFMDVQDLYRRLLEIYSDRGHGNLVAYHHLKTLGFIQDERGIEILVDYLKVLPVHGLVCTGLSGMAVASILSYKTGLPLIVVRTAAEILDKYSDSTIVFDASMFTNQEEEYNLVFIDDQIVTGNTLSFVVSECEAVKNKKLKITYGILYTFLELIEVNSRNGILTHSSKAMNSKRLSELKTELKEVVQCQ